MPVEQQSEQSIIVAVEQQQQGPVGVIGALTENDNGIAIVVGIEERAEKFLPTDTFEYVDRIAFVSKRAVRNEPMADVPEKRQG